MPADRGRRLTVSVDGAARGNPGPAGIGVVAVDGDGRRVGEIAAGIGPATNNAAEYRAAIAGLRLAAERGAEEVVLRSDSRLLVEQLSGRFKVKSPRLRELHAEALELIRGFRRVVLEHVAREFNADADRLANRGVDEWLSGQFGETWEDPERLFEP